MCIVYVCICVCVFVCVCVGVCVCVHFGYVGWQGAQNFIAVVAESDAATASVSCMSLHHACLYICTYVYMYIYI